jgi:hypothetical protein
MRRPVLLALVSVVLGVAFALACGQAANGVDTCTSIEHARCNWIEACFGESGTPPQYYGLPTPASNSADPVDQCYRFYDDACLHGLVTTLVPTSGEVSACVQAINNATDCNIVYNPDTADACAWLIPSDAGVDSD